jgi:hypothetical protein
VGGRASGAVRRAGNPGAGFRLPWLCLRRHRPQVRRPRPGAGAVQREEITRRLYETTTGTAAIVQSLQTHRRLNPSYWDKAQRTVDIASVPGITIGEHPWKRMMAGKKPAPEPLARLVPPDNYYVNFQSIRKLIEFGDWLDQWGTTATSPGDGRAAPTQAAAPSRSKRHSPVAGSIRESKEISLKFPSG